MHCFGGGSYSIIAPYMAEVWPAGLRASGMGLGYGVGNLGKIISPLGLALIVGGGNFFEAGGERHRQLVPAMFFLAFWAALGRGRVPAHRDRDARPFDSEEIDAAICRRSR